MKGTYRFYNYMTDSSTYDPNGGFTTPIRVTKCEMMQEEIDMFTF